MAKNSKKQKNSSKGTKSGNNESTQNPEVKEYYNKKLIVVYLL